MLISKHLFKSHLLSALSIYIWKQASLFNKKEKRMFYYCPPSKKRNIKENHWNSTCHCPYSAIEILLPSIYPFFHHPSFDSEEIPPELPHDSWLSWPHHSAPSIPWFFHHWWRIHLEGKSDKHAKQWKSGGCQSFFDLYGRVVYVIFSDFLLSETSRHDRHEKDNGPLHDQYDWERLESLPVKTLPTNRVGKINHITLIESTKKCQLLSYLSERCQFTAPKLNVDVAPEKVSIPKNSTSYDHVSSAMSCFRAVKQFYAWKLALPLHFPGTNVPRGHKSLDVTNIKTSIVTEADFKKMLLGG